MSQIAATIRGMALLGTFTTAYRAERATARPKRHRTSLLLRAGRTAAKVIPRWATVRTAALSVAGFGSLTAAAWQVAHPLGLAAAGLSLLVLEMLGGDK